LGGKVRAIGKHKVEDGIWDEMRGSSSHKDLWICLIFLIYSYP